MLYSSAKLGKGRKGTAPDLRPAGLGASVAKLIQELPDGLQPEREIIEKAKVLDSFYVPTRYPNGHPEGAPFEHFGPLQSKEAIDYASEVVEFASDKMAPKKEVEKSLDEWTEKLTKKRGRLIRVGYFGSYARGNCGVGIDLDLIILLEES